MKKIILVALSLLIVLGFNAKAQGKYGADSAECIKYLSYYQEYYKSKNYKDATICWRKAYKLCPPTASQNLYIHGATLVRQLINNNKDNQELKKALVDTLMTIYDQRIENYPKKAVSVYNNKGIDLFNYLQDDPETVYNGCKQIVAFNKEQTTPKIFFFELFSAVQLYQNQKLDADILISLYDEIGNYMKSIEMNEENAKVKEDIDNLFISSNVASCENLIKLFTPRYADNPNDIDLLSKIVGMMNNAENCTDNDLFFNAVNSMYKLDPSYKSAYYIARLNSGRGNYQEAIKFLEQAIAFDDSDAKTDASYYYEMSVVAIKNGMSAKAFESAIKAVELDESLAGKAYMICAQAWGSLTCGSDYISKRAQYWVAVDFLNKAKAADSSMEEEANKLIRSYSAYYPEASEAFMYDVTNGQSYTVSCGGLRATTTVRTQK